MARFAPPEVMSVFYEFDKDGSGFIDPEELKRILERLSANQNVHFSDDEVKALFNSADTNTDGKVDLQEFLDWMFEDPNAKQIQDALNQERMSKMGATLLTTPLPWMKATVDRQAFNEAVLKLLRDHTVDATGETTLASAHALLSVAESSVPRELKIEGSEGALLTSDQAAPLVYAALIAGCKSIKVGAVRWGEKLTDACFYGLEQSQSEEISLRGDDLGDEDVADIFCGIGLDSRLHTLDLTGNIVGPKGLEELHAALDRSQILKTVSLTVAADMQGSDILNKIQATLEKRNGSLVQRALDE